MTRVLQSLDLNLGWKLDLHQVALPEPVAQLSIHDVQSRLVEDHTAHWSQRRAGELYTC